MLDHLTGSRRRSVRPDAHDDRPGIEIERRWTPLARVGAYVAGRDRRVIELAADGRVPARVARVGAFIVASRHGRTVGSTQSRWSGRTRRRGSVRRRGGAQAVGALAYGLPGAGIEAVDRIVGPGNTG